MMNVLKVNVKLNRQVSKTTIRALSTVAVLLQAVKIFLAMRVIRATITMRARSMIAAKEERV
jgi:hypothetical protein